MRQAASWLAAASIQQAFSVAHSARGLPSALPHSPPLPPFTPPPRARTTQVWEHGVLMRERLIYRAPGGRVQAGLVVRQGRGGLMRLVPRGVANDW